MKNVVSPSQARTYLGELWEDEQGLMEQAQKFEAEKSRYEMRLLRYQALRDFIEKQFGESPYARPYEEWPDRYSEKGRFRFAGMKLGDAVAQILRESDEPLSLEEIIDCLSNGGASAGLPEPIGPRAVAAALTHTSGIGRYREGAYNGKYVLRDPDKENEDEEWNKAISRKKEGEEIDPDDLPFE